jgi:hypothetical protein
MKRHAKTTRQTPHDHGGKKHKSSGRGRGNCKHPMRGASYENGKLVCTRCGEEIR